MHALPPFAIAPFHTSGVSVFAILLYAIFWFTYQYMLEAFTARQLRMYTPSMQTWCTARALRNLLPHCARRATRCSPRITWRRLCAALYPLRLTRGDMQPIQRAGHNTTVYRLLTAAGILETMAAAYWLEYCCAHRATCDALFACGDSSLHYETLIISPGATATAHNAYVLVSVGAFTAYLRLARAARYARTGCADIGIDRSGGAWRCTVTTVQT